MPGSIEVEFVGGAGTVTGSCSLVRCGDTTMLVDCGTAQGCAQPELDFPPSRLSAVVMSHGHLDQLIGLLC